MITRSNYEIYLIDLLDGKLEEDKKRELMLFLSENPDLKEEFEGVKEAVLTPGKITFTGKNLLKKVAVNENNIDEYLSPEIENRKFSETILTPDHSIVFENKESLKKRDRKPLYYYMSAAASLVIVFFLGVYFTDDKENHISSLQRKEINTELYSNKNELPINSINKIENRKDSASSSSKLMSKSNSLLTYQKKQNISSSKAKNDSMRTDQVQIAYVPQIEEKQDPVKNTSADSSGIALAQNTVPVKTEMINISDKNNEEILVPKNCDTRLKKTWVDLTGKIVSLTNKVIGKKVKIKKEYDCDGNLVQYAFSGDNFGFSKKRSN